MCYIYGETVLTIGDQGFYRYTQCVYTHDCYPVAVSFTMLQDLTRPSEL